MNSRLHRIDEDTIGDKLRHNEPLTSDEVAALFGVSQARIMFIERRALRKLNAAMMGEREKWLDELKRDV